jgi:hypothetical protein
VRSSTGYPRKPVRSSFGRGGVVMLGPSGTSIPVSHFAPRPRHHVEHAARQRVKRSGLAPQPAPIAIRPNQGRRVPPTPRHAPLARPSLCLDLRAPGPSELPGRPRAGLRNRPRAKTCSPTTVRRVRARSPVHAAADGASRRSTILPTMPPFASSSCARLASARGNRCAISGLMRCW